MVAMTNSYQPPLRPRLVVSDAAKAIECYRDVFGADEVARYAAESGAIVHAELRVGQAMWTLKDEDDTDPAPTSAAGVPVLLMLDVDDADGVADRMVAAGGEIVFPVDSEEYGRVGRVRDPFGHMWMIHERPRTGVEARLSRPASVSYLFIPASEPLRSAEFYEAVFGWAIHGRDTGRPGFTDGTGYVSGKWVTDQAISTEPGLLPYIYVDDVDAAVARIRAEGGEVVQAPRADGNLRFATFRDPAGNVLGLWRAAD
jgi:PhnB protein